MAKTEATSPHIDLLDSHFDAWAKGTLSTRDLSKRIKALGFSHDRLDPRQPAGSTTVYSPEGDSVGTF